MRHHQQSAPTDPNKQQNTFHPLKERKKRPNKRDCRLSQTPAPICFCLSDICCVCNVGRKKSKRTFCTWPLRKMVAAMTHFPNKRKQHFINLPSCFRNSNNNEGKKKEVEELVYQMALEPLRSHQSEQAKLTSQQQVKGGKKKKPLEIIIRPKKLGCPVLAMRNFPHKTSCVRSLCPDMESADRTN